MNRILFLALIVTLFSSIALVYSCSDPEERKNSSPQFGTSEKRFVGEQSCRSCHADQFTAWEGSHHDYAMKVANEEYVRGNFDNVTFTHQGESYRFFRQDSLYMVEATGPDGQLKRYQITHTFGWEPLQQYLIDFGKGKLQALNIAWDTKEEEWFALNPEEDIRHGDWLHWTGGAMNWNSMCADCHSTNLEQNYIPSADSFRTTWSSINVSCEACHGPGRDHVELMQSEEASQASIARIRKDLKLTTNTSQIDQINQCAQCHALREDLTDDYSHQGDFLDHYSPSLPHPESYFPDGQIKEEVYVYGSFLQSKMYQQGVQCTDCHDPHTLKLKANVEDNTLCMDCHEPVYNTPEHHFHKMNTEASQCISCHMSGRYYMEVDFRRDHSFRVPRPDLSNKFNTPNACNNCHDQQSANWAAEAIKQWYGPDRPNHFSEVLARADSMGPEVTDELKQLALDAIQPDIARATAIWYLGQFPGTQGVDQLKQALNDKSALVRTSAARSIANMSGESKKNMLLDVVSDSVRAVRIAAAGGLSEFRVSEITPGLKEQFKNALQEYRQYLEVNRYFPQGLMSRGQFYENRGQQDKAIEAYQKALDKDPHFNPARVNLAYLYNAQGNNKRAEGLLKTVIAQEPDYGPAYYAMGLLLAEEDRLDEAIPYFEEAAKRMPEVARVYYNWAIALQNLNQTEQAEQAYRQAITLSPQQPEYRYGICTLYIQQEQYKKALPHAEKLIELRPDDPNIQRLVRFVKNNIQ